MFVVATPSSTLRKLCLTSRHNAYAHLGYPPVGLSDGRVLVVFRVDGQIDGHGRSSPPFFGVPFEPGRGRQVFRVRPRGQLGRTGRRRLSRRWWRRRRRFVHGSLPRVRPNLQQVQQANYLVEFVFLQRKRLL